MKRIKRELRFVTRSDKNSPCPIQMGIKDSNYSKLWAEITGPQQSPYAGGKFSLDIIIPINFPYEPPKISFATKIWHPNISLTTGEICMNFVERSWDVVMTLRGCLLSVQALLDAPLPDDPTECFVAKQYKDDYQVYYATAQHWTNAYAHGPPGNPIYNEQIDQLKECGFDEERARLILSQRNWEMP